MIICYAGTPGSGKSYEAVKTILDNVSLGRVVYTNIDGFGDPIIKEYQKCYLKLDDYKLHGKINYLDSEKMSHFWDFVTAGALVVVDEVHTLFSNRDWSSDGNKGFSTWATHHRHEGSDCILLSHSIDKIDKHVRSCIEWTYFFKKVDFLSGLISKSYLWYAYFGDEVIGKAVKWGRRSYNPYIFKCYKSYFHKDTKELKIITGVNIFKHPIFYIIPVLLIFSIYMIFFKSSFGKGNLLMYDTKKHIEKIDSIKKSENVKNDLLDSNEVNLKKVLYKKGDKTDLSFNAVHSELSGGVSPSISPKVVSVTLCRVSASVETEDFILETRVCGNEKTTIRKEKNSSVPSPIESDPVISDFAKDNYGSPSLEGSHNVF